MRKIVGTPASSGKVSGKTFRIGQRSLSGEGRRHLPREPFIEEVETGRFVEASSIVHDRLSAHLEESNIFAAHLEILDDISQQVITRIQEGALNALSAVEATRSEICALFEDMDDEYLRSRADDIEDLCRQLSFALTDGEVNPFTPMEEQTILIADNLLVSDTLLIDKTKLAGIALRNGSKTSHIAILAREQEIPLVLGIGEEIDSIPDREMVIMDGDRGEVLIDFEEEMLSALTVRSSRSEQDMNPAFTGDGVQIEVLANAGNLDEVKEAIACGADGIGLLRTEFIFMNGNDFPDEDQQYAVYHACASACEGKSLTIRTLDIGADKQLPYSILAADENPLLGIRGIRFSLLYNGIFKVQLRAILRASTLGNIRVMFPMITSPEEFQAATSLLDECKSELRNEGVPFDEKLRPGMMVETPASVILASDFAGVADFFSIGTNDLTQYILAVDRNNPYTEGACDYFHRAVQKSLLEVVTAANAAGIAVSVCGEMGSDPQATTLLLALGVRKLSVSTNQIARIKEQIRSQVINKE